MHCPNKATSLSERASVTVNDSPTRTTLKLSIWPILFIIVPFFFGAVFF